MLTKLHCPPPWSQYPISGKRMTKGKDRQQFYCWWKDFLKFVIGHNGDNLHWEHHSNVFTLARELNHLMKGWRKHGAIKNKNYVDLFCFCKPTTSLGHHFTLKTSEQIKTTADNRLLSVLFNCCWMPITWFTLNSKYIVSCLGMLPMMILPWNDFWPILLI